MRVRAAVLACLPLAAFANPLETDFDKIYADNAALVAQKDGAQSLELPGKILLSRNDEGNVLALDGSPHEAVGCVLRFALQSFAVGKICPQAVSAGQMDTLERNIDGYAGFYAENNVPTRPKADVRAAMDEAVTALEGRMAGAQCDSDQIAQFKEFVATLTSEDAQERVAASLATPRLPVTNPCL